MFAKLVVLLSAVSLALTTITINQPTGLSSGGVAVISWTDDASVGDPTEFSVELDNTAFESQFAIANNIQVASSSFTVTLPAVQTAIQGSDFVLAFVDVSNISSTFASFGPVTVGPPTSSSSTSTSTASSSSTFASSGSSFSSSASSASSSLSALSSSSSVSSPAAGSSSSAPSPTTLNGNGAISSFGSGSASYAVMIVGTIVGATLMAF